MEYTIEPAMFQVIFSEGFCTLSQYGMCIFFVLRVREKITLHSRISFSGHLCPIFTL